MAVRFVFDSSDECTIVHSALYSCLRAVFGLSVAGVLVAVFSCMLGNYQPETGSKYICFDNIFYNFQ